MRTVILAMAFVLLFTAPVQAQTIVLSATFHYDCRPDGAEVCSETLVYVVDALGGLYSQSPAGMHEGVPPCFEGNVWGDPIGGGARPDSCATEGDPGYRCEFRMCQFVTGTGDIFMQTHDGLLTGVPAVWLGNFWGPYTSIQSVTWGSLKAWR